MQSGIKRCVCASPKLMFKLYEFDRGRRSNYKGTCTLCGYVRGWYAAKNYRLIESATGSNQQEGGKS